MKKIIFNSCKANFGEKMKINHSFVILIFILLFTNILFASDDDKRYQDFYQRVVDEEAYIGFFAAEKNCISEITDDYKSARRSYFLGVDTSKEDPETYSDPFMQFCKDSGLLKEGLEKEWGKTLTILNYELYGNVPIFDFSTDKVIEHREIIYSEYPNKKNMLDLFIPKEPMDEPMPVVVCIHGGGWRVNRRIWFEPFAKYLASKGMAAVTIDFRMLPAVTLMDVIYDTKAAVRWVRANAEKYNFDTDRIGAIGASSGAHLVTLLGTTPNIPDLEGDGGNAGVSSEIHAVVGIATPAFKLSDDDRIARWLNLTPDKLKLISPYENISKDSAPLYLIHGTADETVDPQNSQDIYDKYKEVGAYVELEWIPDQGHGFYEGTDMAIEKASRFFLEQFKR